MKIFFNYVASRVGFDLINNDFDKIHLICDGLLINPFGKLPNLLFRPFPSAIMAKVIAREAIPSPSKSSEDQNKPGSVKFTLQVKTIFRKSDDSVVSTTPKGKNISMYVYSRDIDCSCPKIKLKK